MKNRWDEQEAARCTDDLALRVYSSRLLGQDPSLVLHGGGNTSVKLTQPTLFGDEQEVLYVKGSGWDLATIEAAGFTAIELTHLKRLATLETLSDSDMVNELKTHQLQASAPTGSVEAILHAVLPFTFVDHTHADAIITLCNTPSGEARVRELYGDAVIIVPYVMPGFDLARAVAKLFAEQAHAKTIGMVLMNHGLFSFADTARESYQRMIDLVQQAEDYLARHNAWQLPDVTLDSEAAFSRVAAAGLRQRLSDVAGRPMIMQTDAGDSCRAFAARDDIKRISQQGPATPDHVIRTKRVPMIGHALQAYVDAYQAYFSRHAPQSRNPVTMLDPAPRVILDEAMGMITLGKTAAETRINADIYRHTMEIIQRAERLEQWQALPEQAIFDVEYWELEQAKLNKAGEPPVFQGEVALVTGAASGIGRACVEAFLAQGAAVVGLDRDARIQGLWQRQDFLGLTVDVTDAAGIAQALEKAAYRFGGVDMLVLNAGLFPGGTPVAELTDAEWSQVMQVNLDANLRILRESHPLLKRAPRHGRVVVIGSKNFLAPGPGAAAYSASKAALNQLARVTALEWAADGIRINSVHPDAVFDTALWTDEVLAARAAHYGMTVDQYKTKNLLKTEIASVDVAAMVTAMCSPLFAKTTGSQVPIDGGNDRVI